MTDTKPAASPGTRRALVHNAITNALTDAGDWVPLSVRIAATRAALAEVDAWYAADTASSAAVEPPAGQTTPSHRAALRDHIAGALIAWTYRGKDPDPETGILETVRANAYSRADAVLAVLYREWPWLRAEAEDAKPADQAAVDLETARATNQRLNREKQRLESELAAYRRAVSQWEISERGTYVPLRSLAGIAKAAGIDVPARWQLHYERVERAEAERDSLGREADRLRKDWVGMRDRAERAEADRATVLREAADVAETVALRLRLKRDTGAANGAYEVMEELRRMADETATETPEPHRGDAFEQWLKARRDEWAPEGCQPWQILDQTLEEYRLHADTGTPLGEHVCEARVVGDCECLEQPAAGARQDGSQP